MLSHGWEHGFDTPVLPFTCCLTSVSSSVKWADTNVTEWFLGKDARYIIISGQHLLSWALYWTCNTSFKSQMRNWGLAVSCLGYSLQIVELIFELKCVWFETFSMLFLFPFCQLFTDEKKTLGNSWDTSRKGFELLIPHVEGSLALGGERESNKLHVCSSHCILRSVSLLQQFGPPQPIQLTSTEFNTRYVSWMMLKASEINLWWSNIPTSWGKHTWEAGELGGKSTIFHFRQTWLEPSSATN